jgi:hypothetical protein
VGTYDGRTVDVTAVGPYEDDLSSSETAPDFASPCRTPTGGWTGLGAATQAAVGPADAYARSQPDYVTSWVTHLDSGALEAGPIIFNALFTGDPERHRTEIGKVWSGPLCVLASNHPSARELARIRKDVEAGLGELGLQMLWSQTTAVDPVVEIGVVVDVDGQAQAALDARYGPGIVRLVPALKPVS